MEKIEADLAVRKVAVDKKEADAETVLDVAREVAAGRLDLLGQEEDDSEGPSAEGNKAPDQRRFTTRLFARALRVLKQNARSDARAELSEAFTEIQAADDAIVAVTQTLPNSARHAVAQVRKSLTKRIMTLSKTAAGWLGQDRSDPPEQ